MRTKTQSRGTAIRVKIKVFYSVVFKQYFFIITFTTFQFLQTVLAITVVQVLLFNGNKFFLKESSVKFTLLPSGTLLIVILGYS